MSFAGVRPIFQVAGEGVSSKRSSAIALKAQRAVLNS